MNRPLMMRNAVATADYDREQIRRDLTNLRRSVHELCTRSTTGLDCNRLLDVADKAPATVVKATAGGRTASIVCDKV